MTHIALGFLSIFVVACLCFFADTNSGISRNIRENEARNLVAVDSNEITPLDQICPTNFPPLHSVLHDRRPEIVAHYESTIGHQVKQWNREGDDTPKIKVLQDHKFAVWHKLETYDSESSAWDENGHVQGPGWVAPIYPDNPVIELEGDWVGFSSWFIGSFGHFVHDNLSTIAYLKSVVPETTQFLLVDPHPYETEKNFIAFLDPVFYKRIKWIERNQVFHVKGSLTVAIPLAIPITFGCCGGWDPMRQWIAESHPDRPAEKRIVFYTRGGSSDQHHGRVVEANLEKEMIQHIEAAMVKYQRPEKLFIFSGQENGKTMSIAKQFEIFRSASTIIGPHGSGLGGNFAWTNPFPTTCDERVQLLEFFPGQDSAQVQCLYCSYFANIRKWPINYHQVLYTAESTPQTTYINLQDFDDALDAMWG